MFRILLLAVVAALAVTQSSAFMPATPNKVLRPRGHCSLGSMPTSELVSLPPMPASMLQELPSLTLAGAGELGNGQVLGYFAFLFALVAVPFVGGTMDTFRINEFREKRQDFIDAIEGEIAELTTEGTPEALTAATELKGKLMDVYEEIELEKVKDEENKYLGLNRYWLQMRGVTAESEVVAASSRTKNLDGSDRFPDFVPGEKSEEPKGNREERRMAKKVKKTRKPKISNSNP